ncbi:MAG: RagB/SusD family nutrient uptake outer membrane protein [Dysgonamonadaceae bacterium]|nr:RagB/SusD family nutrient uptake outer membrane protein [Dysgonamonadaceae bacterium]
MKKIYTLSLVFLFLFSGCNEWLDREPNDRITATDSYSSRGTINSVIAGIYNRLPDLGGLQNVGYYTQWDEGISGEYINNLINYPGDYAQYYDYQLIRDLNSHLNDLQNVSFLTSDEKAYYIAEARFLRIYIYFEMVKRMGGVPLITQVMEFIPGKPLEEYAIPRAKESDIYDFIASETDEIKEDLNLSPQIQYNRASKGLALAMKCRAMLYAGSLAKYNSLIPVPVVLPGGEVGILAEKANAYFQKALDAFVELESTNMYSLYDTKEDKTANFIEALTKSPSENKELIFVKEFSYPEITQNWTVNNICRTLRPGGVSGVGGSACNPTLNLVDAFERTDGSEPKLTAYADKNHPDGIGTDNTMDTNPNVYIYYDLVSDIFAYKDPRLFATVITPGQSFSGKPVDIRAGIAYYNPNNDKFQFETGSFVTNGNNYLIINRDTLKDDVGQPVLKTGNDGPSSDSFISSSGFYVRKSMDETPKDPTSWISDIQLVRYRYGEAILNAAEAAFELGKLTEAANYLNQIRKRAGMPSKTAITLNDIRNERRVELAFESDHRFFDLKRWRIAHEVFDGDVNSQTAMMYGLWPYKVYRPGHETHNKWIFVRRVNTTVFASPRRFVLSNYYSSFPANALTNNSKLIENPGR